MEPGFAGARCWYFSGEIRKEINRLALEPKKNGLNQQQFDYCGPTKPIEAFYDVTSDPHQVTNLLDKDLNAEQQAALSRMRKAYVDYRTRIQDVGCLPESEMASWIENEGKPIRDVILGKSAHQPDLRSGWDAADKIGNGKSEELLKLLSASDPSVRFWAVLGLRHQAAQNDAVIENVAPHLLDTSTAVRIEVANWLVDSKIYRKEALNLLGVEIWSKNWITALRACRAIELNGEKAKPLLSTMKKLYRMHRDKVGDEHLFIAFSSGAFLEKLGEKTTPWKFYPED